MMWTGLEGESVPHTCCQKNLVIASASSSVYRMTLIRVSNNNVQIPYAAGELNGFILGNSWELTAFSSHHGLQASPFSDIPSKSSQVLQLLVMPLSSNQDLLSGFNPAQSKAKLQSYTLIANIIILQWLGNFSGDEGWPVFPTAFPSLLFACLASFSGVMQSEGRSRGKTET